MNREVLTVRGEALHEELGREYYLTGSGRKAHPAFQAIYDRYADLAGDEALDAARASGSPALLEWIVDVRLGRLVAPLEERQLVWERQAVLEVHGRRVPYLRAPIELANSSDRGFRHALDLARAGAGARALNPIRCERFAGERDAVARLGLGDYVAAMSRLSGIDLEALGTAAGAYLEATADRYADGLAHLVRRRLGCGLGELVRADAAWLFRADAYDAAFPPARLLEVARRQMADLGLDATVQGRVRFDTEEREGKQPRAFCAPVRVPEEVYVVLRPRGGHQDYRTFWHELGHAMHFASVARALPFEARWLGDNSVTEGFAMLWDHLTVTPGWLVRYAGLSRRDAAALGFEAGVHELFMTRRYAAKLRYELELHAGDAMAMGPVYAERLTDATGFRYPAEDHLLDVDSGFYAARYLRAWQLEGALAQRLVEQFDDDWYRNPRAGAFVEALMARGQAAPAEAVAAAADAAPPSFGALARRVEGMVETTGTGA